MNDAEINRLSQNLRILKLKNKLTQKQLADIGGVGVVTISKLLHNQLPPRLGVIALSKLAKHFNLSIADLFY